MTKKEYDGPAVRLGSWGAMRKEGQAIEEYRRPGASLHGPYMVTFLAGGQNGSGGIFKLAFDEKPCLEEVCDASHGAFIRYADAGQLEQIYAALREDRVEDFIELAHAQNQIVICGGKTRWSDGTIAREGQPEWGHEPDACLWIEEHDETVVKYAGKDEVWPTGCWIVQKYGCERQLVDQAQLRYIAEKLLGMPRDYTEITPSKLAPKLKARALEAAFGPDGTDWADYAHSDPQSDMLNAFDAFDVGGDAEPQGQPEAESFLAAFDSF